MSIPSKNIIIYPTGRRQGTGNLNGALLTESRLTSVVNSLLDIDGFVITEPGTSLNTSTALELNVLGRWIYINSSTNISNELQLNSTGHSSAFLGIEIEAATNKIFDEMNGSDSSVSDPDNSSYSGIFIGYDYPVGEKNTYESGSKTYVKIADYDQSSSAWIVPEPEFSKINYIDGGTI